jgi:hypothetical protein
MNGGKDDLEPLALLPIIGPPHIFCITPRISSTLLFTEILFGSSFKKSE